MNMNVNLDMYTALLGGEGIVKLSNGTKIKLKIMGYEPETYFSAGSATLNTAIGGAS